MRDYSKRWYDKEENAWDGITPAKVAYNPDKLEEQAKLQELGDGYTIFKPVPKYTHKKKNLRFDDFAS